MIFLFDDSSARFKIIFSTRCRAAQFLCYWGEYYCVEKAIYLKVAYKIFFKRVFISIKYIGKDTFVSSY